jgi:hypothetical protein
MERINKSSVTDARGNLLSIQWQDQSEDFRQCKLSQIIGDAVGQSTLARSPSLTDNEWVTVQGRKAPASACTASYVRCDTLPARPWRSGSLRPRALTGLERRAGMNDTWAAVQDELAQLTITHRALQDELAAIGEH